MWFVHFHCCTRRGWVHCAEQSRNEHLYRCRPVIFLRFTDRRESIGWHSLSKREDGPPQHQQMVADRISHRVRLCTAQYVWQMLSWLSAVSLAYSSQRVLIIIDTFYTRLRLSAGWGTGSSPLPVGIISVSFYTAVILERLHTQSVSWLLL